MDGRNIKGSRPRELRTEVAGEVQEIRKAFKQFVPHLQALHDKEGHCIKNVVPLRS